VVERKSVRDFHKTIAAGRLWRQLCGIRDSGRSPYLMIEGEHLFRGAIGSDAIRGACLAAIDLGIAVIRTEDAYDTARWLFHLAERRQQGRIRDRPPYAHRPRRPRHISDAEAVLAAVPGISVVTARALLARFGSIAAIVAADRSTLQEVVGVGRERANALHSMIHDERDHDRIH
jgi:ERCC4-type nuclease